MPAMSAIPRDVGDPSRRLAMVDINQSRRRFVLILVILSITALGSAAVLLSPVGESKAVRAQRLDRLRMEVRSKTAEAESLRGIDHKVLTAKDQVAQFYVERLPSGYASVSEEIGKVAGAAGVKLSTGRYHADPANVGGLQFLHVEVAIVGDYFQVVKFINGLEREKMFFVIDSISLTQQHEGIVQLQIKIDALMRAS
jgi:Tfp pilus assembly protein PilO